MRPRIGSLAVLALLSAAASACPRNIVDAVGRNYDGGAGGTIGAGGAGARDAMDATDGVACDGGTDGGCGPTVWPNEISSANSDQWLRDHHDQLTMIKPRVLLLDFYNGATLAATMTTANILIAALAESSRYHGYSDTSATPFVMYQITKIVDLMDHPAASGSNGSTLVPVDTTGAFDAKPLFTQSFADRYAIPDPTQPTHNLTLCELFERGLINEVWLAVGDEPPRGPLIMERKQIYDATGAPKPGMFEPCAGNEQGTCLTGGSIACGVSVRLAHLTPSRGVGCDVEIRGLPLESQGTLQAVPYLNANAARFVNKDFRKFRVAFNSWYDICGASGTCITYPSPTQAMGVTTDGAWTIDPFVQGCGSVRFPPNAHARNDFSSTTIVQSTCEHYGMKDSSSGLDTPDSYSPDKTAKYTAAYPGCGGNWQIYLRQSMPGYRNRATGADGKPMKNWWPFLFY
jgi:hypothetical protein